MVCKILSPWSDERAGTPKSLISPFSRAPTPMAPPNEFPETVDPEAVGSAIEKCSSDAVLAFSLRPTAKKLYRMPCFAPFANGVRDNFYRFNGGLTELQVSLSFALDPLAL
jgi:hypothetical protein